MIKMNPYLNFDGTAEEAFNLYRSVFGGEFLFVNRITEAPNTENLPENERNRLMHISLPINDKTTLMGSDIIPSFGHKLSHGNNTHILIEPQSREEADRLFNALSEGGEIEMAMEDTFWGAYYGNFKDRFGVNWMIHLPTKM